MLGGGSSVNAQVYMRGRPSDYDAWDTLLRGNNDGADWSWNAVLKHFSELSRLMPGCLNLALFLSERIHLFVVLIVSMRLRLRPERSSERVPRLMNNVFL